MKVDWRERPGPCSDRRGGGVSSLTGCGAALDDPFEDHKASNDGNNGAEDHHGEDIGRGGFHFGNDRMQQTRDRQERAGFG